VIPTGAIGNDSPILSRREFWYSRQLGLNLLSIREDPRFGTQKLELSDVVLGEPDAKLFTTPEGSEILDLRAPKQVAAPGTAPHKCFSGAARDGVSLGLTPIVVNVG